MAQSPANTNRKTDGGINFLLGVNSNLDPHALNPAQTSWQINTTNKGGVIDTRPGYVSRLRLPDGRAQGMTSFRPTGGNMHLVMAVNGLIYISEAPFETYTLLPNIVFNPFVDHIVFKEALQAKDGSTVIDPKAVLIMQDGVSKPAYWDGQVSRHLNPGFPAFETQLGLWMEWIGNRLWVAQDRALFASDIFDPLHFTENTYLSIGGSLNAMDGDIITALARTADSRSLLVFTIHNTTIVKAGITDRDSWKTTQDFIALLFPGVGAAAGKSIFYHNGELWWWSVEGARRFTQVGPAILSSRNSVASIEMKRSFENVSQNVQSRTCGFSFGTFLGYSVPSGDIFNRHTWVLDTSTNSQLSSESPFAWLGIWMGTRPVEWTTPNVNGTERSFYISQDPCGVRVWEAFQDDREDNGARIFCSVEFPGLQWNENLSLKTFLYSQFFLSRVSGTVSLTVDYKGDAGCWKQLAAFDICAQDCFTELSCGENATIMNQNRFFKTQEAGHFCGNVDGWPHSENIGTFFQNRIRWYGKNAVRGYKSYADQFQESSTGQCYKGDSTCKVLACCDGEINYVSHVDDCLYGYGSAGSDCCSV